MDIPWVDLETGRALCHAINAATSEPNAELALREFNRCAEQGWTPFLHDFMVGKAHSLASASKAFASRDRHATCFARMLELFPATQGYYPLWEGFHPETATLDEVAKLLDAPKSPWQALGPAQRRSTPLIDRVRRWSRAFATQKHGRISPLAQNNEHGSSSGN